MEARPFISVIVLCYKVVKYLPQCLESLRRQTFRDFEVVMVDDGSPDRCGEICDLYAEMDKRFMVIHKENGGIIAARKTGLHAAKGVWTISVDGDDWVSLDMLEKLAAGVREYRVDFVQCGLLMHFTNRTVRNKYAFPYGLYRGKDYEAAFDDKERYPNGIIEVSLCRSLLKTEVLRQIMDGMDDRNSLCEDAACMAIYAANASSLLQIEDELYHYRGRKGSCTTELANRNMDGLLRLYAHMEQVLADKPLGEPILRDFGAYFARHYLVTVELAVYPLGKKERAEYIERAVRNKRFAALVRRKETEKKGLLFDENVIYSSYVGVITEEAVQKKHDYVADGRLYD